MAKLLLLEWILIPSIQMNISNGKKNSKLPMNYVCAKEHKAEKRVCAIYLLDISVRQQ